MAASHQTRQATEVKSSPREDDASFELQLLADHDTLGMIVIELDRLEAEWYDARGTVAARQRGYFTPDEDDWARRLLLTFRNFRQSLYEIIYRNRYYAKVEDPERRMQSFLLCFGAALTLMSKSLKLIQAYEREPLVRAKLNEADAKYGIDKDLFEQILKSYTSLFNYQKFGRGLWFWCAHRREIKQLVEHHPAEWSWLVELVRREHGVVRRRLGGVMLDHLRYDVGAFWKTTFAPVRKTTYCLQSIVAGACAHIRTTRNYRPGLSPDLLRNLRASLRPGDVLMIRAERKLTSTILPSFWAHSALYVGGEGDLQPLDLTDHPTCRGHLGELRQHDSGLGSVIEAVSPRVRINSLEKSLHADHVLVLRPVLDQRDIREGLMEAFGHLGKPYDYEFDFNVTTRLVCTEIIYRIYHKRGTIHFPLVRRVGRYTLTGDDMVSYVLESPAALPDGSTVPFQVVALLLKTGEGDSRIIPPDEVSDALRRILEGWRPAKMIACAEP